MKSLVAVISFCVLSLFFTSDVSAVSPNLVISQVQTGDSVSASNEAVELYNNSLTDQNITDWCIRYASATTATLSTSPKYCFNVTDTRTKVYLKAHAYAYVATSTYGNTSTVVDGRFTGNGFAAAGGHIKLVDQAGTVIDTLGWGSAAFAESFPTAAPTTTQALARKTGAPLTLQDTDNNLADFGVAVPAFRTGGLYEVRTVVDVCGNVAGAQESLPSGYDYDEAGNCELLSSDKCKNIYLIQVEFPLGMLADVSGNCFIDVCPNLSDLQTTLPLGYELVQNTCVKLENSRLEITEVFANADGSDTGLEYIEIYNPNSEPVKLRGYKLLVGKSFEKAYQIVDNASSQVINPGEYMVLQDGAIGFSLLNTSSGVRVVTPLGEVASETTYVDPKDDMSWSRFEDGWAYTNVQTPGRENQRAEVLAEEIRTVSSTSPATCAAGKYRHPITNRCRNIENDTSMLVACDNDEYRNPETNRCRKIAALTSTLTACNDGYTRNPETNRCRKNTATSSELTPCKEGYERNVETNRCRKVLTSPQATVASASQSPQDTNTVPTNLLLTTVGVGAVSYGLFEWRSELKNAARRLVQLASGK